MGPSFKVFFLLKKVLTDPINSARDPYKKHKHTSTFLFIVIQT